MSQILRRLGVGLLAVCAVVQIGSQNPARAASTTIVISQVYGGGGNSGALLKNDFIELFNKGSVAVDLSGWSVQYASATGNSWTNKTLLSGTIQPGHYFLIQEAAGTGGTQPLPTPDLTGTIAMGGGSGKVALVASTTTLTAPSGGCPTDPAIVDLVSYGGNCGEGGVAAPGTSKNTLSAIRTNSCVDTDNNGADFVAATADPRNSASPANVCNAPTNPGVSPTSVVVAQGDAMLLTAKVDPGTNPTSTGLQVTADLTPILGTIQAMHDDGANGDAVANDSIYSLEVGGVSQAGAFSIAIDATDDQGRTGAATLTLTVAPIVAIHDVQGPGLLSPYAGQIVATRGIVTGVKYNGFFIQTPDADVDADANTSEGVFVYTNSTPPAAAVVGNRVQAIASVSEFGDPYGLSMTELTGPIVSVLSEGNPLPAVTPLTAADLDPAGSIFALEKYEGMRVHLDAVVSTSPTGGSVNETTATSVSSGVFFAVLPATARPFREPGIQAPYPVPTDAPPGTTPPVFDANPERIGVDTFSVFLDPTTAKVYPPPAGTTLEVTTGVTVSNVTGPLDYSYGSYIVDAEGWNMPTADTPNAAVQPVRPRAGYEITVATMNLERFFDDNNAPPPLSEPVLTHDAFQLRLAKASTAIRNVLGAPDVVGVEEVEDLPTLQALAARIAADSGDTIVYTPYLMEGNDIGGIDVGLLARDGRITVTDVQQLGKDTLFDEPGGGTSKLNDRPSLIAHAIVQAPPFDAYPVVIVVNHLRSLSGIDDAVDGPRVRAKRLAQAVELASALQDLQAGGARIISVGDYNAYDVNDGYVDVVGLLKGTEAPETQVTRWAASPVTPPLFDLVDAVPAAQRYSFLFDGNAQAIDHILFSSGVHATGVQYARMNADFPESLRAATGPERLSDHDPLVGYFSIDAVAPVIQKIATDHGTLWPPNHELTPVSVLLTAVDNSGDAPACSITSVSGDDGSSAADWVVTGALTLNLRAERLGMGRGRTYTIEVACTDGSGNATSATTTVTVAHDQRK